MHRYSNLELDGEPSNNNDYTVGEYTTLETNDYTSQGETYYSAQGTFYGSKSTNQEIFFMTRAYEDGQAVPKNTPYPIVGAKYNFATADIDFGDELKIDTSAALYASMAHNMASYTADGTFSLFAPQREGDQYVGVCPGADNIDSVNTTCANLYFLADGETENGATASVVTVGATKFWRVDGLTGTGAFSSTVGEIPGTPNSGGSNNSQLMAFGIGGIGALFVLDQARRRVLKRR